MTVQPDGMSPSGVRSSSSRPADSQEARQSFSEEQWQSDSRLRQVLGAWGHGPEFIESLLSWGYRIEGREPSVAYMDHIQAVHDEAHRNRQP